MKQLRSWHWSTLKVVSEPMSALARNSERDGRTRTTNENCTANESWTRTKYPYDGKGLLASIGSVFAQSLFGPNSGTQGLADFLGQYSNEPGGVDVLAFSGGAQTLSSGIQSGEISKSNIASITYLSPGLGPGGSLSQVGSTQTFHGSGIKDFIATFFTRASGANLGPSVAKGHSFSSEFQSPEVQDRLQSLEGTPRPCPDLLFNLFGFAYLYVDFYPQEYNLMISNYGVIIDFLLGGNIPGNGKK
jgi:hypothetical protein